MLANLFNCNDPYYLYSESKHRRITQKKKKVIMVIHLIRGHLNVECIFVRINMLYVVQPPNFSKCE